MIRRKKKGFTIVELVIVIAVIGILAAILIPTFVSLNDKANKAADDSLVHNLNTAMSIEEGEGKKNNTYNDAIEYLDNYGYRLANLATRAGHDLLWNSKTNRFLLNEQSEFDKDQAETGAKDVDYWTIKDSIPTERKFSIYAGLGWNDENPVTLNGIGFDAGKHSLSSISYSNTGDAKDVTIRTNGGSLVVNAASDSVHHYGDAESVNIIAVKSSSYHENGTVPFIQISQGRIEIEPTGDVNGIHVANVQVVDGEGNITKNANEFSQNVSLDLNGNEVKLTRDTIGTDIASAVLVCEVKEESSSASEFIWLVGDGTIENAKVYVTASNATPDTSVASTTNTSNASEAAMAIANNAVNTGTEQDPVYTAQEAGTSVTAAQEESAFKGYGTLAQPYQIGNVNELVMLSKKVSAGENFEGQYFVMTANIDMKDVLWGVTTETETINCIGTQSHPFKGNFDGKGHTVMNLTNGYRATAASYTSPTSQSTGYYFALFGYVSGGTQENPLEIKNLTVDLDANVPGGSACAGLISSVSGTSYINLTKVTVTGDLIAKEKSSGFIYAFPANSTIILTDCVNAANVSAKERISGFVGFPQATSTIQYINCQNTGNITLLKEGDHYGSTTTYGVAAGFTSHLNSATITYDEKCSNSGTIDAPLAADFQTYAGVLRFNYSDGTWTTTGAGSCLYDYAVMMRGIIRSESSKAFATAFETAKNSSHCLDGIYYDSNNIYVVEVERRESSDYRFRDKYTLEEWNNSVVSKHGITGKDESGTTTITLLSDLTWTQSYSVGTSRNLVIDLNGHTLTATSSILSGQGATKFTFKNGEINAEGVTLVSGSGYSEVNFENVTGSYIDQ